MKLDWVEAVQPKVERAHWSSYFAFLCVTLVVLVATFGACWSLGSRAREKIAPVPSSEFRRVKVGRGE